MFLIPLLLPTCASNTWGQSSEFTMPQVVGWSQVQTRSSAGGRYGDKKRGGRGKSECTRSLGNELHHQNWSRPWRYETLHYVLIFIQGFFFKIKFALCRLLYFLFYLISSALVVAFICLVCFYGFTLTLFHITLWSRPEFSIVCCFFLSYCDCVFSVKHFVTLSATPTKFYLVLFMTDSSQT